MEKFRNKKKKARLTMLYKITLGIVEVPKDKLTISDKRTRGNINLGKYQQIKISINFHFILVHVLFLTGIHYPKQ